MFPFRVGVCLLFVMMASAEPRATGSSAIEEVKVRSVYRHNFMPTFGDTTAPIGFINFCRLNADKCLSNSDGHARLSLSFERKSELAGVNDRVNALIRPATDQELYGAVEHWTIPVSQGDCEDYVLLKRKLLMDSGWPSSALLITVVRDERGDGHAVLTVRTKQGDLILDNKQSRIVPWRETGYEFIKRQSYREPSAWVSLTPAEAYIAGAASARSLPQD